MTGFHETRYQLGIALVDRIRAGTLDERQLRDMLSQKPDLAVSDAEDGLTALLWCVRQDKSKFVMMLLDAGADPAQLTRECGLDAVMIAAIYNSIDSMEVLIDRNCALGNRDAFGHYAIQHAVSGDCAEVVTMLLQKRPDLILVRDQREHTLHQLADMELRKKAKFALETFDMRRAFTIPDAIKPVIVRKFRPKGGPA